VSSDTQTEPAFAHIADILSAHYGITLTRLVPLTPGWSALAYRADRELYCMADNGNSYAAVWISVKKHSTAQRETERFPLHFSAGV